MKDAHNAFNFNRPEIASEILQRAQQVAFISAGMKKRASIAASPESLDRERTAFGGSDKKPRDRAILKLRYPTR